MSLHRKIAAVCLVLLAAAPAAVGAEQKDIVQVDERSINIIVDSSAISVIGAQGHTLEVVSLTGLPVKKIKIESQSQTIQLDVPKGCYILKVEDVVRKVTVK